MSLDSNTVALSQEELDKLFSKGGNTEPSNIHRQAEKNIDPKNIFLTEDELRSVKEKFSSIIAVFKSEIDKTYSDFGKRKIFVSNLEQMSLLDFFEEASPLDFLYEIDFSERKTFLKLDQHLFPAISGLDFKQNRGTNIFQSEALKTLIVPHLSGAVTKGKKKQIRTKIIANDPGISVSINWNEDFKSFGVEKFFVPKETFEFLSKESLL